jgi:hypothetical protein
MDGDWTHPVAHGKSLGNEHHTHEGHGCSEDRKGQIISAAEYSRLLCVVGVLTEKFMGLRAEVCDDPEELGHVIITQEELVRISTKSLKMGFDEVGLAIILKVED